MSDQTATARDIALLGTPARRIRFAVALALLVILPFAVKPFLLDLANQVLLAVIGALALMLLTGFAGLISLGTAGLLGAVIGALIVATAEILAIQYVNPLLSDVVPFVVLLIVLAIRPWGLFGSREQLDRV